MTDENTRKLLASFNRIKNILYKKETKSHAFRKLQDILSSELSEDDKQLLLKIAEYIKAMQKSIEDLGTEILELTVENKDSYGVEVIDADDIMKHVQKMILLIDSFIDSFSAMVRSMDFEEERFELKYRESYLKSIRHKLIGIVQKLKLKSNMLNNEDEIKIKIFINDMIDMTIRQSVSMRLKDLHNLIVEKLNG